jgi:hypothetical protein
MKLIIDLDQRPDGRLAGSALLPGDPTPRPFSGVMELVARVEELSRAVAEPPRPARGDA